MGTFNIGAGWMTLHHEHGLEYAHHFIEESGQGSQCDERAV